MRLHRVRLRDYRGVEDCEVEFSAEGITIVEGPNEIGKTCIPQGLDLLLNMFDSSKHREVMSAKPVGRNAGPEVEAEITTGPYRFVYSKRWLRQPDTALEVVEPRHEQLGGREAHNRVEEILGETLDDDLWAALRIEQGTELAVPSFDVKSMTRALDLAASGGSAADEDDDLWTRICDERDKYWTTTGRPKRRRAEQKTAVDEAREEVSGLRQRLDGMDGRMSELNRLENNAMRLARTVQECEQSEQELSDQRDSAQRLRYEVQRRTDAHDAAKQKQARLASEWGRRQEAVGEVSDAAEKLAGLEAEAQRQEPVLAEALLQASAAEAALGAARAAVRAAESEQRRADEDRDHRRREIEAQQLSERHERVIAAEQSYMEAAALLDAAKIDDDLLDQVEQAYLAVVRAEAAVASVETLAVRQLSMQVGGQPVTLASGETHQAVVDNELVLSLPDIATIRVRAGAGSRNLTAERRNAREELRRLCETGDVADLSGARRAAEQRKEAERRRDQAARTIQQDLRDLTVGALRDKVAGLSRRITAYAAERPADPPLPADFEEAKRIAAARSRAAESRRTEFEAREHAANRAGKALSRHQHTESNLVGRIEMARIAYQDATSRLADSRAQRSDDAITAELATSAKEAEETAGARQEAEAELQAADLDSLEARISNARKAAKRARDELQSNRTRQDELRFDLAVQGEEGLETLHEEALGRLHHVERDHHRTEARSQAASLLHDTFLRHRQESRKRYVGPFKDRIEELGRIVFNSSFSVELGDDLSVARRTLDGDTLKIDQLSTGAREQLGLIGRLACAAIVSPDGGGAPVIIDDALGWSDPERLERMGAAIAASGEQCQVIILTCTPGRYAHIGNATTVRLPSGT